MVIVIGASSCSGKTLMSQKLLEKYKIPYYSIDHLKMGIFRSNENCGFNPCDSSIKIANNLWPVIKGIIMTAIENKQNIIIEGCYVFPQHISELAESYRQEILPVFFGFSPNYIKNSFESGIIKHRSIIELREYEEERPPEIFIDDNTYYREQCKMYQYKYFEINCNYENEIEEIYNYIDQEYLEALS